jgi:hypothetical protein
MGFTVDLRDAIDSFLRAIASALTPRPDVRHVYGFQVRMTIEALTKFQDHVSPLVDELRAIIYCRNV